MSRRYPVPRGVERLEVIQQEILRWRMTQRIAQKRGNAVHELEASRCVDGWLDRWAILRSAVTDGSRPV